MDNNHKIDTHYPMQSRDIDLLVAHARALRNQAIGEACSRMVHLIRKSIRII